MRFADLFGGGERRNTNQPRAGFRDNPTVFGQILRGDLPADILYEDDQVLCFRDISPASDFHTLVIPKRLIESCNHVSASDVPLLRHMESIALQVWQKEHPDSSVLAACASSSVSLGYHKPPFITVKHLHLHCIYPLPVPWFFPISRLLAFPQHYGPFYASSSMIIEQAEAGEKAG